MSEAASVAFVTYQDNGGGYHWEIVDASGAILAHSEKFVSQDDAERAARTVREGARLARPQSHVSTERKTVSV